jgi:CheY-like chemotaxis protein
LWVEDLPIDTPAASGLILESVFDLLAPLLLQNRVHLKYQPDESFRDMFIPPNTVRQSLLIVLDWMIPLATGRQITLAPRVDGSTLVVAATIPFPAHLARNAFASDALPPGIGVLKQLLEHNGGSHKLETTATALMVSFSIPALAQIPVLMIDDNPDTIHLFERYLQETHYAFVGATQPAEIERLVARYQPRIIILDVMMPEIDGWELLVRLRQYQDTTETIILVCSILPLGDLARSLGANGFLQKPVAPQDLVQELNALSAHLANVQ